MVLPDFTVPVGRFIGCIVTKEQVNDIAHWPDLDAYLFLFIFTTRFSETDTLRIINRYKSANRVVDHSKHQASPANFLDDLTTYCA